LKVKRVNSFVLRPPRTLLTVLLCSVFATAFAQREVSPVLERKITVSVSNETLASALNKISKAGNFTFSYNSSLIRKDEMVTFSFADYTVREILDELLKGRVEYKERGQYVILLKVKRESKARDARMLSGYVIDEATGERLKNVSVYDPVTLSSAVTDDYGFFRIDIKNPTGDDIKLAVKKNLYTDTVVVVPAKNKRLLRIPISVNKEKLGVMADSVGNKFRRFWIATRKATEQAVNLENISDTIYRKYQFGFVPFVGTNGALSGNVINDYSVNVIGGYSYGNRVAEVSGVFSMTRGGVRGVQAAGVANGVFGTQNGILLAGLVNFTADSAVGVNLSGLTNVNFGGKRTVDVAGMLNFTTGDARSWSFAGIGNFTNGNQSGPQGAGVFNFSGKNFTGVQASGVFNFVNGDVKGMQVAGVFNYGRNVRGVQIGLFNFAREQKGVPIGLLSFVSRGYHKIEIAADEVFYTNVAFRTGIRALYNIITVGAQPHTFSEPETTWSFGYGVGSAPKLTSWLSLNVDVSASQIVRGKIEKINLLNKFFTGLDVHLSRHFSVFAGVTLNGHITDRLYADYPEIFTDYVPSIISSRDIGDNLNLSMWWGGKAGIRLL
jgi:hypothetical protein